MVLAQIVYCDFKRYQSSETKDTIFDSDIGRDISYDEKDKKTHDLCKSSNPVKDLSAYIMAYVVRTAKVPPVASQIQICPCR